MSTDDASEEQEYLTKTGIPVRNVWYMLLYAWGQSHLLARWKSQVESAPGIDALLASILVAQFKQRLRIGLGGGYCRVANEVYGVRGQVDFSESIRRMSLPHGRTYSRYQIFDSNVPKNQIIRSTLARLAQNGYLGPASDATRDLKEQLRRLVREVDTIDLVELESAEIKRVQSLQKDADYRLMLAVCQMLLMRQMPTEFAGSRFLSGIDRDSLTLHAVFEKFVAEFYRLHLSGWHVFPQKTIRWPASGSSTLLPVMKPDIVFQHKDSGQIIMLDTKFTKKSLVQGQWDNVTFNRDHLFQIYAYIRSQEDCSGKYGDSAGVLLYPAVNQTLREKAHIQGHDIHWRTIDLANSWQEIHNALVSLIKRVAH